MNFNLGQFDPAIGMNPPDDDEELWAELLELEGGDDPSSSKAPNRAGVATKGQSAPKKAEAHKKATATTGKPAGKAAPAGLDMVAEYTKAMNLSSDPIASIGDIPHISDDDDLEGDDALMVIANQVP